MVWPVGFLRFGKGTLATYGPGSSRIMKFQRKMKVLGVLAGRGKEYLQGGRTARLGSNIIENVRFGRLGALSRTLATSALFRPLLPDLPAPVPGP